MSNQPYSSGLVRKMLADYRKAKPIRLKAETLYTRLYGSYTSPILAGCEDDQVYVVKAPHTTKDVRRSLITDHLVALVGTAMGASVGEPIQVVITQDFIDVNPDLLYDYEPGIAHATLHIPDCSDDLLIRHTNQQNRVRFVLLALLFGWCVPGDRQFLYENKPPHLVHSVDHGHFLPRSTNWSIRSLQEAAMVEIDEYIVNQSQISLRDIQTAICCLEQVEDREMLRYIARIPEQWGIEDEEREALFAFFRARRDALLAQYR